MAFAIKVDGLWDEGYVFDMYIKSSRYLGEDPFGHAAFKNTYTEIGELLYAMKYNGKIDTSREIASHCSGFLSSWLTSKNIDVILPTPPTMPRDAQPVFMIVEALSEILNLPCTTEVLEKVSDKQSKNMSGDKTDLVGTIRKLKSAKRACNILLVDDIYSTGQTATQCVAVLKSDELIKKIYYFAIAKTKPKEAEGRL